MTAYCTFFIRDQLFGIEVSKVQEILRPQELTPVPLAQNYVSGLLNLRGQILLTYSMRRKLDLANGEPEAPPMNLVLPTPEGPVGFQVDQISEVVEVGDLRPVPPPSTLSATIRKMAAEVYMLKERLLVVLDPLKLAEA
jgi:purine-binding chemotaxis protein CheW